MCGVNDTDLCVAIFRFSQVVFVTSNNFTHNLLFVLIFVLRRKGSKTKKIMKEEEIEKGDYRPPTPKVFFCVDFVGLEPNGI